MNLTIVYLIMIKNIIYLDIDGVMCLATSPLDESGSYFLFNDSSLSVLNSLLKIEGTFIVVSSSWKYYKSIDTLKLNVFNRYNLSDYILNKTPDLCMLNDDLDREDEIYNFIKNYPSCNHLVLDDLNLNFDNYDFNFLNGRFLNYTVQGHVGLCDVDLKYLLSFLKGE